MGSKGHVATKVVTRSARRCPQAVGRPTPAARRRWRPYRERRPGHREHRARPVLPVLAALLDAEVGEVVGAGVQAHDQPATGVRPRITGLPDAKASGLPCRSYKASDERVSHRVRLSGHRVRTARRSRRVRLVARVRGCLVHDRARSRAVRRARHRSGAAPQRSFSATQGRTLAVTGDARYHCRVRSPFAVTSGYHLLDSPPRGEACLSWQASAA